MLQALKDPKSARCDRSVTMWGKECIARVSLKVSAGYRTDAKSAVLHAWVMGFPEEETLEQTFLVPQQDKHRKSISCRRSIVAS